MLLCKSPSIRSILSRTHWLDMYFRGVINGKAGKHLPYRNLGVQLTLFQPGGQIMPTPLLLAWLCLNPDYAPDLRVGRVSIIPMNCNEKYFRKETDSEEH